jgi:DNA-binding response OmpR family regulator
VANELVLVVDDDAGFRALIVTMLERAGYRPVEAADGKEALRSLYEERPGLVMLDVSMPRLDGFQTLERIRELSNVPVLMLTGRDGELDAVRGLKGGADHYVSKPFRKHELLAQVGAALRRSSETTELPEVYQDEVLTIDLRQRAVTVDDRPVSLTPLEFKLLYVLVSHPNQVLSRGQLLELVWGGDWVSSEQVKNYIGYLRRKLGRRVAIETVRGFGYRFNPATRRRRSPRLVPAGAATEDRALRAVEPGRSL